MNREQLPTYLQEYFNRNRYDEAVRFLEDLLREEPEQNREGSLDYHLGRIFYFRKGFDSARKHFLSAIRINSRHVPAKFFLARTLEALDEHQDLLKLYADCQADRPKMEQIGDFIRDHLRRKPFVREELRFLNAPPRQGDARTAPLISIIILCYNKAEYTEKCLASLFQHDEMVPYEVIVLDNASVDDSPFLLETYSRRITFVRSDINLGFVIGNNEAARHAQGDYLLFLNNDTVVTKGWLAELYACFQLYPDTGAAGAMLLYPDGRLQEAGGIIFQDGTGWNYGRNASPSASSFQFTREVDYCSGAALMVRRDLYEKIGGFDRRFAPAYYEDTDLCFSIRKLGYRVRYCPHARVFHHEGATAGTDLNSGFKKYQNLNAPTFRGKWAKELALQCPQNPDLIYRFSNRHRGKRILIIDDLPPLPDRAAGSLRLFHTANQLLHLGCQVTYAHLMGRDLDPTARKYMKDFRSRGVEFIWFEYETWWPIRESPTVKPILRRLIQALELPRRNFDLVYICFWHIASYFLDFIREADPKVPILIDSMDLHYLREIRQAEVKEDPALKKKALETKRAELKVYSKADCVTTVTEQDREYLRKDLARIPVFILTDVHEPIEQVPPFAERSGLVFVGNFNHRPNEDAVLYFVKDILPLIRRDLPEVVFFIVGNNPPPSVHALSSERVIVTGWVPSVRPYLQRCRVEVVPLRYGAGNKGKVGEAFAHGIPMVMTSIGAEGMKVIHGEHAFIADSAEDFARYVVRLYSEPEIWGQFSSLGRRHVTSMYGSDLQKRRIEYILSFGNRGAFRSYRALQHSLPPELSIIMPFVNRDANLEPAITASRESLQFSHELLAAGSCLTDRDREELQISYPAIRMPDDFHASLLESINDAISRSLGKRILLGSPDVDKNAEGIRKLKSIDDPRGDIQFEFPAGKNRGWIIGRRSVFEAIGGLDERFRTWPGAIFDFFIRARLAGLSIYSSGAEKEGVLVDPDPLDPIDADLFRKKWQIEPKVALGPALPPTSQEVLFPIHRDPCIRYWKQGLYYKKFKDFLAALASMFRTVNVFHSADRRGFSLEFPQILAEIDNLLDQGGGSSDPGLQIAKLMETQPGDKRLALGATEYLLEENRFQEAAEVMKSWISGGGAQEMPSETLASKAQALSSALLASQSQAPLVSIIILTYNQLRYTRECVESLRRHTPQPHEIVFVDNGSSDGTDKWLRQQVGKNINYRLIENKTNHGFSKGSNQGIKAARGKYILLLNNDVVLTEGWLTGLLECLESSQRTGIVGPMANSISGPQQVPKVGYSSVTDLDEYARSFREKNLGRRIPFRRIVGFCMLFRRELVEKIGLLDESFGTGNFEDDDFCLRAELAGYRNLIAGDVFIHHFGSRSFVGNKIDYRKTMKGNRNYFVEKWDRRDLQCPEGKRYLALRGRETARSDYEKGQAKKAVDRLLAVIRSEIKVKENYYELAELLLDTKQYDQALKILEQMPDADQDDRKYALSGYCQEGLANPLEAQKFADQALSLNPSNALALNLKGILSYRKGDKGEAQNYFQKAAAADPGFGEPHTNLGVIRWEDNRQKEALQLFERGFILSPTITDILQLYHTAVTQTGEFTRAEQNFFEAKALHLSHRGIRFFLIDILLKQEKYEDAMEEIEQVMGDFGIEEGMLEAALGVRKRIGPRERSRQKQGDRISLCMIVKDEENHLGKCLRSVKPVVDEIIVVDTGSTDRTRDIAVALGAKVFEFSWQNDFSAARNFSISRASGDWVLVLDADEVISPQDHASLLRLVRAGSLRAGYSMVTRNYLNTLSVTQWTVNDGTYDEEAGNGWIPSEKVRLFPRDRRIHFENPVHEFVEPSLERNRIPIHKCSIAVHHYGKLNERKEERKGEEYFLLGKKKLEKSNADLQSLRELAVQANILKRHKEAAELWHRVIGLQPDLQEAYINLTSIYMNLGKFQEASAASQKAIVLNPDCKEAVLNYSIVEFALGNLKKVISELERLLSKIPEYPLAMGLLSVAYKLDGELEKSQSLIDRIKKAGFNYEEYLENTARHLIALGRSTEAELLREMIEGKGLWVQLRGASPS
jgi:GT2 family glycosyltransferase/Tfp pilus assembly protein PilF